MKKNLKLLLILIVLTVVSGVVWYINGDTDRTLTANPLADFAIEDTSAVTKIFISDANGKTITVERVPGDRYWDLNGKFKARKDAIDIILKTFKRIKVKSPVPSSGRENAIKLIQTGKRVDVYTDSDTPMKTYFVGTATSDHTGTYMVLEVDGEERSTEPFITHMEGFTGFLSTRFFTDLEEWRYTGIFDYPDIREVKKVEVINHEKEEESFDIEFNGGNDIRLHSRLLDRDLAAFDTLAVKDYFLKYKKVHLETYQSHMSEELEEALLNTQAAYTIRVTNREGQVKKIDLYWKPATNQEYDVNGDLIMIDQARMYGVVGGSDVVLVQTYVFDPLLIPLDYFVLKSS